MRQDDRSGFGRRAFARTLPGLIAGAALLAGCASPAGTSQAPGATIAGAAPPPARHDPFEAANRRLFRFGRALDHAFISPIVGGYRRIAPKPVRTALHNVLQNLDEPLVFVNDVLQLHPATAARTAVRFAGNTTFGIGGIFDPATKAGLPHHDNGFGSTLGRYGVGPGPYGYLPLLGPTSLRDMVGEGVDFFIDPLANVLPKARKVTITRTALTLLDEREEAEEDLRKLEGSADPYATLRSVYEQSRQADIKGPDAPLEELPEIPPGPAETPATPPARPPVAEPAPPK